MPERRDCRKPGLPENRDCLRRVDVSLKKAYLLSVKGLEEEVCYREALTRIDRARRERVLSCVTKEDRLRSLGAGLLLQCGVREWTEAAGGKAAGNWKQTSLVKAAGNWSGLPLEEPTGPWKHLSLEEAMEPAGPVRELCYNYGPAGKPYLADSQLFFSISHSGDYVACTFADREVGLDLQQVRRLDAEKLARRFFSEEELALIGALETEQQRADCFFRLWCRKEAYGKLTGRGAAGVLGMNVSGDMPDVEWEEYGGLPDYFISICTYTDEG